MIGKKRKSALSALYAANASLQYWLDAGEYKGKAEEEIARLTHDIDALRVTIESGGFGEFARMKLMRICDTCGTLAEAYDGYGSHLLRFMSRMDVAL